MVDKEVLKLGFRAACRLGLENIALRAYDLTTDFADFPVDKEIAEFQLATQEERGAVLIPLVQGHSGVNAYRYAIFAHAFRVRGYEPVIVQCDAHLPVCHRKDQSWADDSVCSICQFYGNELLDSFGLSAIRLSELVDLQDNSYSAHGKIYKGIDTSRFAIASSRKYLKKYHVDKDDPEEGSVYQNFHIAAKIIVDATEKLIEKYDVRVALAHDDKYVYGGIPLAVADKHDIPAYSHGLGYRAKKVMFGKTTNKSSLPWFSDSKVLSERLSKPLTSQQTAAVRDFMAQRSSGDGDSRHHYSSFSDDSINTGNEKLAGMFTNLIWDASLEHDTAAYPDVFDWIRDTVEYFSEKENAHLVVKTHPAEAIRGTNESIYEWIHSNLDVNGNVTVLEPDTSVNTYELIQDLDAGIVYNSTVGLEMAFRELPVIVGGETHYRNLGFTFDPDSSDEYHSLLDDIGELEFTTDMQQRVERYTYFLFYQKHLPFPFYESNPNHEVDLLPVATDDVAPGVEMFDSLVSRCVAGEPIYDRNPTGRD